MSFTKMYILKEVHPAQVGLLKYEAYGPCGDAYRSIDSPIDGIYVMGVDLVPRLIGTGSAIKTTNNDILPVCPVEGYLATDPASDFILDESNNFLTEDF